MLCKKCGIKFIQCKGLINYCSLKCRNSRIWTEEDKLKKSIAAKKRNESYYELIDNKKILKEEQKKLLEQKIEFYKLNKLISPSEKIKNYYNKKLLNENFNDLSFERLRKRVILEQNNKCNCCGLEYWFGKKISLELEHIDGNNKNNLRENLKVLCPNCHSITDTWRGRNKTKIRKEKINPESFIAAFIEYGNIRKALLSLNIAAKGANYSKMYKFLRLAGIDLQK